MHSNPSENSDQNGKTQRFRRPFYAPNNATGTLGNAPMNTTVNMEAIPTATYDIIFF